jgi:hypothetical protein
MVDTTKGGGGEVAGGGEGGIDNSFIMFGETVGPINGGVDVITAFSTEDVLDSGTWVEDGFIVM